MKPSRLFSIMLLLGLTLGLAPQVKGGSQFGTLHEVVRHFQVAFVDRANMSALLFGALEGLSQAAPKAQVTLAGKQGLYKVSAGKDSVLISQKALESFKELEKALVSAAALVHKKKLVKNKKVLEHAMVRQMVAHCGDKWTVFLEAEYFDRLLDDGSQQTGSAGLLVEHYSAGLRVLDVVPGTPAAKAGIKIGQPVQFIAGRKAASLNELEALAFMRGKIGTKVELIIGGKKHALEMAPEPKRNLSVTPLPDGIAHVKLMNFRPQTGQRMAAVMRKLGQHYKGDMKGLILDLRGNPGGLVTEGTEVVGLFIKGGKVVEVVSKQHMQVEAEQSPRPGAYRDLPIVILVDHRSASVSEIVSVALRDYGRAKLVGQTTLGKGTVQVYMELMDGSALKMSTGRYYSPKGTPIFSGLEPDYEVAWDGQGEDKQLAKALKLLKR